MKVNGTQSTPPLNPNQFSVEELHNLATDPDFKVTIGHAIKLGVHTFEHAQALLKQTPLSNENIIALLQIMRTHLMWIIGPQSGKVQQLARELSDGQLQALDTCTGKLPMQLFQSQMTLLVNAVKDILEGEQKEAFEKDIARAAASAKDERDAAGVLLPLLLSVTEPAWEQRAAKEVQHGIGHYLGWATSSDQAYFSQAPFPYFANGQTARSIRECLRDPQRFGISVGGLSGTYAVHHLQSALLCEILSSNEADPATPETFQLDAKHVTRLRKSFADLVQAQSVVDLCGQRFGGDKDGLFRRVYFAICQGDENFGLNLPPEQLAQLNKMSSDKNNPVVKLHRTRMHKLLLGSMNTFQVNNETFKQWNYAPSVRQNLETMREHLMRIVDVNYRVFSNIYACILENEIDRLTCTSLLNFEDDQAFRDWVGEDLQENAFGIRDNFRALARDLIPVVTKNRGPDLVPGMRRCLIDNQGWQELCELLQGGGPKTDFKGIHAKLIALYNSLGELRTKQRKLRHDEAVREKGRVLPHQLKSGFR